MHIEDDRGNAQSGPADIPSRLSQAESGVSDVRRQLAVLLSRLTGVESDLAALKTGLCVAETRLGGIENRQRHAESRRERNESRFSAIDYGVDRVQTDMATLKDRVRCVELDLRELSGALCRGSRQGAESDTLGPMSRAASRQAGFNSR